MFAKKKVTRSRVIIKFFVDLRYQSYKSSLSLYTMLWCFYFYRILRIWIQNVTLYNIKYMRKQLYYATNLMAFLSFFCYFFI